jgi:hypothetical protein
MWGQPRLGCPVQRSETAVSSMPANPDKSAIIIPPVTSALRARIKHFLKRLTVVALSSALSVTALAYAVDYLVFRDRVAANLQPFGQVTVTRYDAVAQKNGKTQFIFNPPETQTCVHTLFPRKGYVPCWYLQRHTEQRTDI